MCKHFHLHDSFSCSVNVNAKEVPLVFCFEFKRLGVQPCWFALYHWRAEKGWLVTCLIPFLPHISVLVISSLTQTVGHKKAALTVVFLAAVKRRCLTKTTRNRSEKLQWVPPPLPPPPPADFPRPRPPPPQPPHPPSLHIFYSIPIDRTSLCFSASGPL